MQKQSSLHLNVMNRMYAGHVRRGGMGFKPALKLNRAAPALGKDTYRSARTRMARAAWDAHCYSPHSCGHRQDQAGAWRHTHTHTQWGRRLSRHIANAKYHTRLRNTKAALICIHSIAYAAPHKHTFHHWQRKICHQQTPSSRKHRDKSHWPVQI